PSGEIPVTIQFVNPLDAAVCAGPAIAEDSTPGSMLKVRRSGNGEVVFTVSGRLDATNVSELSALLAVEPAGGTPVLDLKDVVLVDRNVVRFLQAGEKDGIVLRNCPPYIRE